MTDKIEIGEYIRTKRGSIGKFKFYGIDDEHLVCFLNDKGLNCVDDYKVVNHSKNIIDLIQVGDFVNEKLIHSIKKGKNYCYLYYEDNKTFVDYQIKEILTKEMYKQNVFKVVE